jgi:hypothetical protein
LQKFITLHKARLVYFWGWCRMLVEIALLPQGCSTGSQVCPSNLKRLRTTPTQLLHFWKSIVQLCTTFIILCLLCVKRPDQPPKKRKLKFWWSLKALFLLSLCPQMQAPIFLWRICTIPRRKNFPSLANNFWSFKKI